MNYEKRITQIISSRLACHSGCNRQTDKGVQIMKEHPQAEILRAIAYGKTVQFRYSTSSPWEDSENALRVIVNNPDGEFRIMPETININGFEVPCPVREPLKYKQEYYVPSIAKAELWIRFRWDGRKDDLRFLECGLIHLTKEAAITHAEALLSFTRSDK